MKKGFALITVLAVVIVIALGTAAILQAVGSSTNMKINNLKDVQAQYLAEAGMQYALWKCRLANGGCADNLGYTITTNGITTAVPIDVTPLEGGATTVQVSVDYVDI